MSSNELQNVCYLTKCNNRGTAWGIPLLPVELPFVSEEDRRSYRPKSDFSVSYWPNGCPCLIGEVVSNKRIAAGCLSRESPSPGPVGS